MIIRDENQIILSGCISDGFTGGHEIVGKKMYTGTMNVFRQNNGIFDEIPVVIEEHMYKEGKGLLCSVYGEVRSRKISNSGKTMGTIYVKAAKIEYLEKPEYEDINDAYLMGKVLKVNPLIKKGLEEWKLAQILLKIKRFEMQNGYSRTDLISCLTWNENAEMAKNIKSDQEIKIRGKFQSWKRWCKQKQKEVTDLDILIEKLEVL